MKNLLHYNSINYVILAVAGFGNPTSTKDRDIMVVVSPILPHLSTNLPIGFISGTEDPYLQDKVFELVPELKTSVLPVDLNIVSTTEFEKRALKMNRQIWDVLTHDNELYSTKYFEQAKELMRRHYYSPYRYYMATGGHVAKYMKQYSKKGDIKDLQKAYSLLEELKANLSKFEQIGGSYRELPKGIDVEAIASGLKDIDVGTSAKSISTDVRHTVLKLLHPVLSHKIELPLNSSHGAYAMYDLESKTLEYQFSDNSKLYYYYNVPVSEIDAWLEAPSKGKYFNANIRGNVAYEK